MTTGLQAIPLAVAGPMMADALGMSWADSREEVVKRVNKFRNLIFNDYPENGLFSNVFHCICISCFSEGCSTKCSTGNKFHGFSVPPDVAGIEAIFDAGESLTLHSRWREARSSLPQRCGSRLDGAIEMAAQFPTERDLDSISLIKLFATDMQDSGKIVTVEVIDADFEHKVLAFTLIGDSWASVEDVHVREILSVSLPFDRKGIVKIAQTDGRELSHYQPWELVPTYRRFKAPSHCVSRSVLIQGTKRFRPIVWDSDVVEVGDGLVIDHAGQYFKHSENTTDQKELRTAKYHKDEMKAQLAGLIARHRGHAIQDGPPARAQTTASTRLPGYR